MRIRNLVIYSDDRDKLERLRDEYRDYCGHQVKLLRGRLIVFARPPRYRKPKEATEYKGAM